MEIKNSRQVKGVAFQGYQHKKTETGAQAYHFNCMYDTSKYDCEFQAFKVGVDHKKNLFIKKGCDGTMEPFFTVNVPKEGIVVEPEYDLDLAAEEPFGYRFALRNKTTGHIEYVHEDNNEPEGCTIISRKGTSVTKQGPMYLAMHDSFAPGYVYAGFEADNTGDLIEPDFNQKKEIAKKARKSVRTFSNAMGGTMAGLEAKLGDLHKSGFKRLITTPLWGGCNASAFGYWNENNFIITPSAGNINNYDSLLKKACSMGMNLVDDMTFTSEGLQGIHYQRAIKWMDNEEKPLEYYYFRMNGLQNAPMGLGVIPENFKNLNHKLVNSPFDYVFKKDKVGNPYYKAVENKDFDPKKPTYIQIFDDTMVSKEQRQDKKNLIGAYDNNNPDNKLAINTHDDTIIQYAFQIDPYEYKKNVDNLNEVNKIKNDKVKLDTAAGTMFAAYMSGISIEKKNEGGFVCWDANTDMVKMNYFTSNYDNELIAAEKDPLKRIKEMDNYRRGNYAVRDMACAAAKFRTQHVRNVGTEYVAKTIGEISDNPAKAYNRISGILNTQNPDNPKLPEDMRLDKDVIANVIENNYEMRPILEDYHENLISTLMDLPLDSIEFSPEAQAALSSPYLSKRSPDEEHILDSRYDAMLDSTYVVPKEYEKTYNKMNNIFTGEIKDFADKVLQKADENSKEKLFKDGELTEYGKYLIPLVGQDIAKYAIIKGLVPDAGAKIIRGGEIAYDYDKLRNEGTLLKMGVNGDSQKDEANQIANRLKKGVKELSSKDVEFVAQSINKRFANTNANSLKLAEAMIDNSGWGLDGRFDAAKDVADFDSVRNGKQRFDTAWKNVSKFWADIDIAMKRENRNSYTVAEFTDLGSLIDGSMPDNRLDVVYDSSGKAVSTFFDMTGITSDANYDYFFDGITNLFGYSFTEGVDTVNDSNSERSRKLEDCLQRFASRPIDYKRNSYTFASNHDKPRMIHCLSMDMNLFNSDLNNIHDIEHRKTAYMLMNSKMGLDDNDWNIIKNDKGYFRNISSKAIANADLLKRSIDKVNETLKNAEINDINNKNIDNGEKHRLINDTNRKYDNIYGALLLSIADVVKGNYHKNDDNVNHNSDLPDDYKKVLEQDGFGAKAVPDAFDIVLDQAKTKYRLTELNDEKDLKQYRDMVDSKATEVGRAKTRIIFRYLNALPGNPTLYGGDELGMSGYEDKCNNTYNFNRGWLDWSMVEGDPEFSRDDITQYKNDIYGITALRSDEGMNVMEALNNGTMHKLSRIDARGLDGASYNCSGIINQAANGVMNISVFNPNGISTSPLVDESQIHPTTVTLDRINLRGDKGKMSLPVGTTFKNVIGTDDSVYKVFNEGDNYFIKKVVNGNPANIDMNETTAPDGVMMLYHIPDDIESSRKNLISKKVRARKYFNAKHNIPNDAAYKSVNKPDNDNGNKMDVTSKE